MKFFVSQCILKVYIVYCSQYIKCAIALGLKKHFKNTLLLKTVPDTCGPGIKCTANYSQYLNINEDCTKISTGYGSYFFSPDFTLEKHN